MTIRHIRIFLAVCACGCNTTRAAETLHMTQPAVSLAIHELERYYGVLLFDRMGRRLVLTEAGSRFQEYGRHITGLFDDMEKTMRDWDRIGLLRVGASITIGSQFLPHYIKAFYARHPGAEVQVTVATSDELERRLMDNTLDLALMEGVPKSPAIRAEEYMEDHLTVICSNSSGFRQGQTLSLEEFCRQKFLLRERGSGTREEFERVMEAAGISVQPVWEAVSTTALVNAVICGLGIAVVPYRMVLGPLERGLVTAVRVEGLSFSRRFRIACHRDKYITPLASAFMDLCRNYEMDYPMPRYSGLY